LVEAHGPTIETAYEAFEAVMSDRITELATSDADPNEPDGVSRSNV
jgi:hypothetical protein